MCGLRPASFPFWLGYDGQYFVKLLGTVYDFLTWTFSMDPIQSAIISWNLNWVSVIDVCRNFALCLGITLNFQKHSHLHINFSQIMGDISTKAYAQWVVITITNSSSKTVVVKNVRQMWGKFHKDGKSLVSSTRHILTTCLCR